MPDHKAFAQKHANPRLGMILMISMALLLPVMDSIGKYLTAFLSPGTIALFRFIIQAALFMALLGVRRQLDFPRLHLRTLVLLGGIICVVMLTLMLGLSVLPLATFIAIFFVEPLILVFFSILFLGEKVGWRRITACCVGLLGALIIIRPNYATFGVYALMPVITAICMAGYFTITKQLQGKMDGIAVQGWATLFGSCFLAIAILAGTMSGIEDLSFSWPQQPHWGWLALSATIGVLAYVLIAEAFKRAPASLLAPFQYIEIVAATILGYLVFGDFPDALTWLGIAIILGSGLYVFYREQYADQSPD
ncbi:DMT family transporter [uncultured Maritalea sp.]|uniref:DMT family transporter n=1 Tax=uncultured Maritalea sp. TaxID=757249 RepID=UPI0026228C70|nr:DMT family transporter [uncultured Maritalea sp.]